jgi:hypothetical protein
MILLLLLLVICWSHCVLTQPLQDDQYIALMNVYDGLGSFPHSRSFRILRFFFFFFFFFLQDATPQCAHDSMRQRVVSARICVVLMEMSHNCAFEEEAARCLSFFASELQTRVLCCRNLPKVQLTGSIPSTIGQLTALDYLYVIVLICRAWS